MSCNYNFAKWEKWENRNILSGINYPGIYCIAIAEYDISGKNFEWIPDITYIGMTNSKGGLKSRLKQFDNTIRWKEGHGGACRVRRKYPIYRELVSKLFVSVFSFHCDVNQINPQNLRIMGDVAKHEYDCIAAYVEIFGEQPEFNDKDRSPKSDKNMKSHYSSET
ncbi:hypothetical protein V7O61_07490 [Methanolobus sp. WCC1]|jgi:hypothetical protein|uniref:hypothetical protein n=1 Tax=unclassified Methanolobus TaxID=2629569 RepID=UPI00258AD4E0|nr:hypothetical protein [Methanolobus sp.]MDK2831239.1 hypothetical protein [Methanolobus sp.]